MLHILQLQPNDFSQDLDIDVTHSELASLLSSLANDDFKDEIALILENDERFTSFQFDSVQICETTDNQLIIIDNDVLLTTL